MKLIDILNINITPKFTKEDLQPLLEKEKPKIKEYNVEFLDKNNFIIGQAFTIKSEDSWHARREVKRLNYIKRADLRATSAYIKEVGSKIPKEWVTL